MPTDYLSILYIVLIALVVLLIILIPGKKTPAIKKEGEKQQSKLIITSQDIQAIAGEDEIVTQLDMARAYIEMGRKNLAEQLLRHVTQNGNLTQRQEAKQLLDTL